LFIHELQNDEEQKGEKGEKSTILNFCMIGSGKVGGDRYFKETER